MSVALYPYNYFMIMFALGLKNSVLNEIAAQKKSAESNMLLGAKV